MFGMLLAYMAALAAQPAQPENGAEATYRQAESLKAKEPLRARMLYESAARQGHAPAQSALGILLFKEGNRSGALRWLKMAADGGDARALMIYGTAQFNGDGVPPNRIQGYAMVRQAAALGLADAAATQSEMELVMPRSERDAAMKLAAPAVPEEVAKEPEPALASTAVSGSPKGRTGRKVARTPKLATASVTKSKVKASSSSANSTASRTTGAQPRTASGPWRIQLGAFRQPGAGQALFARLAPRLPGKQPNYVPLGTMTRLVVGPYASLAEANAACRALGRQQACMPIKA